MSAVVFDSSVLIAILHQEPVTTSSAFMPRTRTPKISPSELELIERLSAEISHLGWQTVRSQIITQPEFGLSRLRQKPIKTKIRLFRLMAISN